MADLHTPQATTPGSPEGLMESVNSNIIDLKSQPDRDYVLKLEYTLSDEAIHLEMTLPLRYATVYLAEGEDKKTSQRHQQALDAAEKARTIGKSKVTPDAEQIIGSLGELILRHTTCQSHRD